MTLKSMGFEQSSYKAVVCQWGKGSCALLVITSTKDDEVEAFKEDMKVAFQMSDLGHMSFYLGIVVSQSDSGVTLR